MAEIRRDEDEPVVPGAFLERIADQIYMNAPADFLRPPVAINNDDDNAADLEHDEEEVETGTEDLQQRMPLGQKDSRRMQLSEEERGWAIAIKQAIQEDPDLEPVSDFLAAQIALIDRGDVEAALERAQKLQGFRHEYDMTTEDLESSNQILRKLVELFPGYVLSTSFSEEKGNYVLVLDVSKLFLERKIKTVEGSMRTFMAGMYLILHVCNPDFESVRRGMYSLTEYEGYSWKNNFGISIYKTFWVDLVTAYPLRLVQLKNFNTGLFGNLIVSMSRSFLPNQIYSKFHLGCVCEQGRLDEIFMAPNPAVATEKMLTGMNEVLQMRYANEASFKL